MDRSFIERVRGQVEQLHRDGVFKRQNVLDGPQGPRVRMQGRGEVLVLSSNNYLGLAAEPEVVRAGREGLDRWGAGTASVRFICGTFGIHVELERALARFVGTEAALTFVSCWTANEGLIPTLLDESDVVISDALNHASIIDSVRLCRAARRVYPHSDMGALEELLRECSSASARLIVTDGVFSMDGDVARLPDIVELARRHGAVVVVDDSHATGVLGASGRGTAEHFGMVGEVDIVTSTLGKALGGAAGGFAAAAEPVIEYLVQRARPQLFSNALPPTVAASALAALERLLGHPELVERLRENTRYFRGRLLDAGFRPMPGETPIVPILVGDTAMAIRCSERLLEEGVFVTGFGYPVVPQGKARLRCQISAAHTREDLDFAIGAFRKVATELGLL
jgi:glycine C-acetyltransferase